MPGRVQFFVASVVVAAIVAVAYLSLLNPTIRVSILGGAISFTLLGAFAHFFNYKVQGTTTGAATLTPFLVAMMLYPGWPTICLIAIAVMFAEFNKKKPWIKRIFNVSQQTLAAAGGVLVFRWAGGVSLQELPQLQPIPEAAATCAYLIVNTLSVASVVAISERKNLLGVWRGNVAGSLVNYAVSIPWVHAFALVFAAFGYLGVVFIAFLLFGLRQLNHATITLRKYNQELLEVLVQTVEMRDPYTSGHSQRVSKYARIVARAINLPKHQIDRIEVAALLHDVGKIHEIFEPILKKPGRLTPEERATMELHPLKSVELVEKVSELEDVLPAIRHHHENWDGSGYPDRLVGANIPLGSRIIMFADTIDAMTTDRPYRKAMTEQEVRVELERMMGKQFDPAICAALLASPLYPQLFNGEDSRGTSTLTQIFDLAQRKVTPLTGAPNSALRSSAAKSIA
jgi:putative nucleotidyltransferase with HDIG domain